MPFWAGRVGVGGGVRCRCYGAVPVGCCCRGPWPVRRWSVGCTRSARRRPGVGLRFGLGSRPRHAGVGGQQASHSVTDARAQRSRPGALLSARRDDDRQGVTERPCRTLSTLREHARRLHHFNQTEMASPSAVASALTCADQGRALIRSARTGIVPVWSPTGADPEPVRHRCHPR